MTGEWLSLKHHSQLQASQQLTGFLTTWLLKKISIRPTRLMISVNNDKESICSSKMLMASY